MISLLVCSVVRVISIMFSLDICGFPCHCQTKKVGGLSHFLGQLCCFQGTKEDTRTEKPCCSKKSSSFILVILCHLLLQEVLISAFYNTVGEILALTIKVTGAFHKHSNHVFLCTNCNLLKMACLYKVFH